jgi:NAD(P)-dependent dehydrogenase (short-subunit alcohol dehydrogenase family)
MMKAPLFDPTWQIALITGSSRGLGFVLAKGSCEVGAAAVY